MLMDYYSWMFLGSHSQHVPDLPSAVLGSHETARKTREHTRTACSWQAAMYKQVLQIARVLPEEEAVLAAGTMGRTAEIGADGTLWPL